MRSIRGLNFSMLQDVLKLYAQMILQVLSQTRTHWTMNYVELGTEVHVCTWCHQDLCALGHMTITTWKKTHSKSEYCGVKIKTDRVAQTNKKTEQNTSKRTSKPKPIQKKPKTDHSWLDRYRVFQLHTTRFPLTFVRGSYGVNRRQQMLEQW